MRNSSPASLASTAGAGPSPRRRLFSRLLPTPDEIVASYLTHDEVFILVDEPSTNAFLLEAANEILIIVALALVTGFVVGQGGGTVVAVLGLMGIAVLGTILTVRRLQAWYTRYALTDFRVIRSWGVLNRQMAWIPWSKVTDVLLTQTLAGRILRYATVRIESANEASGFKAITDLRDPHRFHRCITEMVQAKQGKTTPPWMVKPTPGPMADDAVTLPVVALPPGSPPVAEDPYDD